MWRFYAPDISPTMGTALPADPVDGQEFTLVDSMSAPTYSWKLRYVSAKSSNKWVFIGGSPGVASVTAAESTTSASYAALTTAGPSFTIPIAGDYVIGVGCEVQQATNAALARMSYDIGGTGAVDADATGVTQNATWIGTSYAQKKQSALAASTALTAKYKTSAATATFSKRVMYVTPVAIGG